LTFLFVVLYLHIISLNKNKLAKTQKLMKTNTSYMTGTLIALFVMIFSFSGFSTKWIVMVANFQFTPSSIPSVNSGDTIRWEWVSGTHTTTSTTIPAGAGTWDAPIDAVNTFFEYMPLISGTYNYQCMHHPSMVASFTVNGVTPTLNVTPTNQNVTYVVGTTTFTVTSNSSWTAVSNASWCTPTPSGTGDGTITANYLSNPTVTQRVASITVTVSGLSPQVVTVTQDGEPRQLAVTPSNQNVTMPAGTTDFTVTSNTDWVAVSNSTWCTVTPSGTGSGTLTATYTDNASGPPRVANITVTVTGLSPQLVTVSQDGTTGISENTTNTLHVFPNPTTGQLNVISGESAGKLDDLTVMDITGRTIYSNLVRSGQQYAIDLSSYPGGYYFVRVSSDTGTLTRKVILEK
jgi:plastocyanin